MALNKNMEPLLELQRRTKAGEVAPLVDVATKNFWLWPGKAYWAYCRKEKIAVRQLELRKEKHLASDARIANVVALIGQIYNEADWPERGELFFGLMAEDSWPMVATLIDEDEVDDLGLVHFLEKIKQQYGKLALEEIDMIAKIKTVGELALLLEKIVSEDREKMDPCKRRQWRARGCLRIALLIVRAGAVAWLVVVSLFAWYMRDGLGPDAVDSHGFSALARTVAAFVDMGWMAALILLLSQIGLCKLAQSSD